MANVVPLVKIPLNAFMKAFSHNCKTLEALRRRAKLSDGFFMYREWSNMTDSMPMIGKMSGNWRLGRIRVIENDPVYDYGIEIYRRSLNRTDSFGSVWAAYAMDNSGLAEMLRQLNKGTNIASYPSLYEIEASDTFTKLGFEIN